MRWNFHHSKAFSLWISDTKRSAMPNLEYIETVLCRQIKRTHKRQHIMYSARAVARLNSSNGTLIWDDVIAISHNGKGNQKENIRPEFDASLNRTKEMRKSE